jgi:hypothetical protein
LFFYVSCFGSLKNAYEHAVPSIAQQKVTSLLQSDEKGALKQLQ